MENAESILVIILSVFLAIFLVSAIVLIVKCIQLVNQAKRVTNKAEAIVDKAESIGDFIQKTTASLSIGSVVSRVATSFFHHKGNAKRRKQA